MHGVDLGALEPALPGRLQTATKRIHLVPEVFAKDIARVRRIFFERNDQISTLQLIGRRDLRSNNSWGHNSYRLVKGPRRCTLRMHPKDASARSLQDGEIVQIRSRVGVLKAVLQVTDELLPGVVSLPHGWGHDRPSIKLSVAAGQPGISVNDLTDDQFIDQLSGNAALNGIAVSVEPLGVD